MPRRQEWKPLKKGDIPISFSREDWAEIYYALESKAKHIEQGFYGKEGDEHLWIAHLGAMMQRIEKAVDV